MRLQLKSNNKYTQLILKLRIELNIYLKPSYSSVEDLTVWLFFI